MLKATIIQHTAADSAGRILPLLEQLGVAATIIRLDLGDAIPTSTNDQMLLTFGAPISLVNDDAPAWVQQERALLRSSVDQGKSVLGICFGAQLLATALGGSVKVNPAPEAGWHKVWQVSEPCEKSLFSTLPKEWMAFHWHRNTFTIPSGADSLFRSELCENQSFHLGDQVIGLQFHFEIDKKTIRRFLIASDLWQAESLGVQGRDELLRSSDLFLQQQQEYLEQFVKEFVSRSA